MKQIYNWWFAESFEKDQIEFSLFQDKIVTVMDVRYLNNRKIHWWNVKHANPNAYFDNTRHLFFDKPIWLKKFKILVRE